MLPRSQTRNSAASSTVMKLRRRPSQCRSCAIAYVSARCEKSSSPRFFALSSLRSSSGGVSSFCQAGSVCAGVMMHISSKTRNLAAAY